MYVERNLAINLTIILIIEPSFIETAANSGWWPANDHISRYLTTLFIWSETIISPIVILLQCNGHITSVVTDSTNDPWLQSSKLSRPMNQSGEGTNLVITEIWKRKYNDQPMKSLSFSPSSKWMKLLRRVYTTLVLVCVSTHQYFVLALSLVDQYLCHRGCGCFTTELKTWIYDKNSQLRIQNVHYERIKIKVSYI